ncbi:zinc finger, CCHC-type containing protein [Tanacetum coccineum]
MELGHFGVMKGFKMRALLIKIWHVKQLGGFTRGRCGSAEAKLASFDTLWILALWREDLTFGGCDGTINSKEINERSKAKGDDGERLYVRGRTDRRDSHQSMGKSRSKSRGGRLKCNICQSEDHLKRNCPKNNRKKSIGYIKKDDQPSSSGSFMTFLEGYDGDEQTGSARFDHGFRMYIPELKRNLISLGTFEKEGFTVKLQLGKVKVINGSRVVLSGIRRILRLHLKVLGQYQYGGTSGAGKASRSVWQGEEGMGLYSQVQTRGIWKVQRVEAIVRESDWLRTVKGSEDG